MQRSISQLLASTSSVISNELLTPSNGTKLWKDGSKVDHSKSTTHSEAQSEGPDLSNTECKLLSYRMLIWLVRMIWMTSTLFWQCLQKNLSHYKMTNRDRQVLLRKRLKESISSNLQRSNVKRTKRKEESEQKRLESLKMQERKSLSKSARPKKLLRLQSKKRSELRMRKSMLSRSKKRPFWKNWMERKRSAKKRKSNWNSSRRPL